MSIFIAFGSNLSCNSFGSSQEIIEASVKVLDKEGIFLVNFSSFYETEPVPKSDQPNYINAVGEFQTDLSPEELLKTLLKVENLFGRTRETVNAARLLDLDLLCYNDLIIENSFLNLPHPRMHERAFVLIPLSDISPDFVHPLLKTPIGSLIESLDPNQSIDLV